MEQILAQMEHYSCVPYLNPENNAQWKWHDSKI